MNKNKTLTQAQAQAIVLGHQGLLHPTTEKGKKAVLQTIEALGYVQLDTLSVVARAHHHTLWSRLSGYNENYLSVLLEEKSIFEYWSHAASYLPMRDYRFSLPQKKAYESGKSHWFAQDKKMNKFVLERIKTEGALQSKDFEFKREGPGNWYEWKPAKRALEQLFMEGKLMVEKRQGFQKVYNLTDRVLPVGIDTAMPTEKETAEYLIRNAMQAHGIVTEAEITYLRTAFKASVTKALRHLLKDGELEEVKIAGLEKPYYIGANYGSFPDTKTNKNRIHFLSPFDNLIIQRKRIQTLFNFDYMIECYLPESKRTYGYFTLPVLYNNTFVARFDPKADRANKTFYIKSIHFEKAFKPDVAFNNTFALKLKEFAAFNGCDKIVIGKADTAWKKNILSAIKSI